MLIRVCRYQASRDDLAVFGALKGVSAEHVNVSRWYSHIAALAGPRYAEFYFDFLIPI